MEYYEVIKVVAKWRLGQIVNDDDPYVRRKIQEGDCLKHRPDIKSMDGNYENKAMKANQNKGEVK
jgi:hypothetical protein